jgi:hypothetical protein
MKRLSFTLLALFSILISTHAIYAQHQRLGLQPQTIKINGRGLSNAVEAEAYCLDKHLLASTKPVGYGVVLTDETTALVTIGRRRPVSLQQAITNGDINVEGSGGRGETFASHLSLRFTSNVNEPVTIQLLKPLAMGEKARSWVRPDVLKPLENPLKPAQAKDIQDPVWLAGINESRLQALGYHFGNADEVSVESLKNATRAFQRSNGLPLSGEFDPLTIKALKNEEDAAIETLTRLGFGVTRSVSETEVKSIGDALRLYQKHLGLPETGFLNNSLRAQMAEDMRYLPQVLEVEATDLTPAAYLGSSNSAPHVLTFQKYEKFNTVLVNTPRGPVLWVRNTEGKIYRWPERGEMKTYTRRAGAEALKYLDVIAITQAINNSTPNRLILQVGIHLPGGRIPVAFGRENPFIVTQTEMSDFLAGRAGLPAIDRYLSNLSPGTEKPAVIISRSSFFQGRGGDAGNGESPLGGFGYEQTDPIMLYKAFNKRYGDKVDLSLANDLRLGIANLKEMPKFEKGSQMAVYVDKRRIGSYGEITHVKNALKGAEIRIVKAGNAKTGESPVILFAGQRNENFQALVKQLAAERRFENSLVAFAVCGEGCEVSFNSGIIRESGARAILFYDQRIHPDAVESVLLKFSELLIKEGVPDSKFQQLWRRSVEEVLKNCTPPRCNREDVEKLRDAILQLSALPHRQSDTNAE